MLGKLLLTVAVVVLAIYAVRQRTGGGANAPHGPTRGADGGRLLSRGNLIQFAAALVVATMLIGSALALLQGWERRRDIVTVEIANPITGAVEHFEARRTDVGEQTIRTLDGRRIRVSEVERIIILDHR
jgi:hypothetical protein